MSPTVTQAPNGQGLVWGLGDGVPATFPDIDDAYRAVRSADLARAAVREAEAMQPFNTQEKTRG